MMQKQHWKLTCIIALSNLLLQQRQFNGFPLRCPYSSEWNIRATQICGKLSNYYCLWDDYRKEYSESCRDKPELWPEGRKCVIRQNPDSEECTFERFQPFIFSTEGYSDCVYSKYSCEDKGLVNHNNGSTSHDRNCRCDFNDGYAFVLKPRNIFFCIPSQEDCSCYQHRCDEAFKPSAEYNCTNDTMDRSLMKERLLSPEKPVSILQTENTLRIERDILSDVLRNVARGLVIIGIVAAIGCIVVLVLNTFGQPECFMEHELYRSTQDEDVILQCRLISYFPIKLVSWRNKSTNEIFVNDDHYSFMEKPPFVLVIRQANTNQSGLYECTLKSCIFGSFVCSTQLKVESSSVLSIVPSYFPGTEDTILLACSLPTELFEVKSIIWKRKINNEVVNIASATNWKEKYSVISEPPSLKIMNSNADDTGKYICLLSNGVEQIITSIVIDTSDSLSSIVQSQVVQLGAEIDMVKRKTRRFRERPEIITEQLSFNITEGGTVALNSEARYSLTKLVWEKSIGDNISLIDAENTDKYEGGTIVCPTLTIKMADVSDEGHYTCFATNDIGTTQSATISLTVVESTNQLYMLKESNMSQLHLTLPEEKGTDKDKCNTGTSDSLSSIVQSQVVLLGAEIDTVKEKARRFRNEETRIILVGKTGVGKSSIANTLFGRNIFKANDDPTPVTEMCMKAKGIVGHKPFLLIETPGIFSINGEEKETELEIKRCFNLAAPGPHVILFVIEYGRISKDDFDSIEICLNHFGEKLKQFVIIVFTHADKVNECQTFEKWLEKNPELERFLNECGRRFCLMNNEANEQDKQEYIICLMNAIEALTLKDGMLLYTDDAIMEAEVSVLEKEQIIEQTIISEFKHKIEDIVQNIIQLNQGSSDSAAVISTAQHKREIEDLHSHYQQKLEKVREEARDAFLNYSENIKEIFSKK